MGFAATEVVVPFTPAQSYPDPPLLRRDPSHSPPCHSPSPALHTANSVPATVIVTLPATYPSHHHLSEISQTEAGVIIVRKAGERDDPFRPLGQV
jgi:hypothetical protein